MLISIVLVFSSFCAIAQNDQWMTNELVVHNPPVWLKKVKVERVTDSIQNKLEWKTRRVSLFWHKSHDTYSKAHSLGPLAVAVTIKSKNKTAIHMSPNVNEANYQSILGHELVHVIFYQKYKGAIPDWLEEGFANFYGRQKKVDKKWLAKQKIPSDVTQLTHPFKGSYGDIHLIYKVSQAMVEFLDKRCDLDNLLRLSVQKKLEDYIKRTCGIENFNQDFKAWLYKP